LAAWCEAGGSNNISPAKTTRYSIIFRTLRATKNSRQARGVKREQSCLVLKPTWPAWRVRPFTSLWWWNGTSGKKQKTYNKDCAADGFEDHGSDRSPTSRAWQQETSGVVCNGIWRPACGAIISGRRAPHSSADWVSRMAAQLLSARLRP
jgi:hypothetical protein